MRLLVRCTPEKCKQCIYYVGVIESPYMKYCKYIEVEGKSRMFGTDGRKKHEADLCDKFILKTDNKKRRAKKGRK